MALCFLCPEKRYIIGQSCVVLVCEAKIKETGLLLLFLLLFFIICLVFFLVFLSFLKDYCLNQILLCQKPGLIAGIPIDHKGGVLFNPVRPAFPCTHCSSPYFFFFFLSLFPSSLASPRLKYCHSRPSDIQRPSLTGLVTLIFSLPYCFAI